MPAHAEIVLEGELIESVTAKEGPFGEFTGYYASSPSEQPVVEVKRVYYRNDPIIGIASPMRPPSDFSFSKCVMKAGMIWDEVERAGLSGVAGVWVHEFGGARMFNVIAIKQAYPGHARQAGLLAAGCQSASYLGTLRRRGRRGCRSDRPVRRDVGDLHALRSRQRHRLRAPGLERAARSDCSTRRARPIRAPSSTPAGRSSGSRIFPWSRARAPSWCSRSRRSSPAFSARSAAPEGEWRNGE